MTASLANGWFTSAGSEPASDYIKPPLSNKGGIKNKRQETKVSGNAEYIRENPVL